MAVPAAVGTASPGRTSGGASAQGQKAPCGGAWSAWRARRRAQRGVARNGWGGFLEAVADVIDDVIGAADVVTATFAFDVTGAFALQHCLFFFIECFGKLFLGI